MHPKGISTFLSQCFSCTNAHSLNKLFVCPVLVWMLIVLSIDDLNAVFI